jgi:excisionase family DNA binding protein
VSLAEQLRRLCDALPPGGTVSFTRDVLLELIRAADDDGDNRDLTTAEVGLALGVDGSTVRRMCESGQLRGYKPNAGERSVWRVPRAALEEFRRQQQAVRPPVLRSVPIRRRGSA